jgi:signal transduction histidine kinase
MKILSVDDKSENLYMLEALLRGHGHHVDSASNGVDALHLAGRSCYDLIISDILMPRMDGFQLCRELKKDPKLSATPFIFYTATYTDPRDAEFAMSLGADHFLVKPLEPEVFVQAIELVIARRRDAGGAPPVQETEDEAIYLKEYNARLIAKLEKKMIDLEQVNRALQADIAERERTEAERARLEQQLRQAQKMEAVGTLAGGIAHDFNNILTGIIGFAQLARADAGNPDATRQHVEEILRAGERARELVKQILAFSRRQEQEWQPLKLHQVIADAIRLPRATIPRSIEIQSSLDPAAPSVLADSTQIHQVIANLLTNAWHAIGDKPGRIRIELSSMEVDADFAEANPNLSAGPYVRLSVSDTGAGMDPATADRIFDPFFTTKAQGDGTGLGLAVVHGIVKATDGAITVYTELGHGTTFNLYFPALDRDAATEQEPKAEPTLPGRGQRILFIDDERILTTLGERFLTRLGYVPVVENDPVIALRRFNEEHFDAVATDLTMPHLSGLDVGRQILHLKPGTPIILCTGFSATLDADRARSLGFRELLLKPYDIDSLGAALRRALKPQ